METIGPVDVSRVRAGNVARCSGAPTTACARARRSPTCCSAPTTRAAARPSIWSARHRAAAGDDGLHDPPDRRPRHGPHVQVLHRARRATRSATASATRRSTTRTCSVDDDDAGRQRLDQGDASTSRTPARRRRAPTSSSSTSTTPDAPASAQRPIKRLEGFTKVDARRRARPRPYLSRSRSPTSRSSTGDGQAGCVDQGRYGIQIAQLRAPTSRHPAQDTITVTGRSTPKPTSSPSSRRSRAPTPRVTSQRA